MSEVKVNKISPRSGTTITLGDSGDTFTVPSGVTFDASSGGLAGTLTTAAQPNITSVGTLTSFSSTGIDDNATSTAITIDSSENVGIGSGNLGLGTSSVQNLSSGRSVLQINNTNDALINLSTSLTRRGYIYATTTGYNVFSASAIPLIFGTDGTEAMRIDSSGNVGIGNSIPSSFNANANNLVVGSGSGSEGITIYTGSSDKGVIYFADASTGTGEYAGFVDYQHSTNSLRFGTNDGTEKMRIDSSGNVGIGTTSPNAELHISKSADANSTELILENTFTASGSTDEIIQLQARFGGYDASYIITGKEEDFTTSANRSSFMSFTTRKDGTLSEKLRIKADGKVGIGTSSPNEKLQIYNTLSGSSFAQFTNLDTGSNDNNGLYVGVVSGGNAYVGLRDTNGSDLLFQTENTERMRINSSGNVGIGTSNPSVKFQVDTPVLNAHVTNIKMSQGGWSSSINKLKSLAWGDPNTLGAIGLSYDGNKTDMKWHSFYNAGYKTETTTIMTLTGTGNLSVSGSLSKGSGSFIIDHPLPSKKETHNLVHSFVEAPQADNIYRGKINLVNGTATINIDIVSGMTEGTFVLLNREIQCFTSNETGWIAVKGSVSGNTLTITAQDNTCDDTISWMVIGERQDQHMYNTEWTDENGKVIVEPLKETETTTP
jgi:hypothetical protein